MLAGLHHRDRNGEGRRVRAFDLMHVKHPLWLTELCPRENGGRSLRTAINVLPSLPLACQRWPCASTSADELRPPKMERVNGVAPSSRPWHGRILLLNHTREMVSPAGLSPAA